MQTILNFTAATVFFVIGIFNLQAQDNALDAIEKIYNGYSNGTAIHFTGSIKMYAKNEPSRILDHLQSSYTLKNSHFSCSIGPVSMLLNNDYYVSVDNSAKLIMLGHKKDLPAMAGNPVLNLAQLKKWLKEKKMQASLSVNGDAAILQLTDINAVSGFTFYHIAFNTNTGYMKRVVMESAAHTEKGKIIVLEIKYSAPLPAGNYSFSEKDFFSIVDNRLQLSEVYRNYQLINQL